MPRKYVPKNGSKRYRTYTDDMIKQACEELAKGSIKCLATIAKKYNMSKSALHRHSCKTMKRPGGQRVLSDETELEIVRYLNICADWGYPMETYDLRLIVKLYLDKTGIKQTRFKNNMPGLDFAANFIKRHEKIISQKLCRNIKRNKTGITMELVNEYFNELEQSLKGVPLQNIVNYHEISLTDDPSRKKVILKRGTKYPERVVTYSKSPISIMLAGSAAGELLPAYVVYKSQKIEGTYGRGGPKGIRSNKSTSGWFDSPSFFDFIKYIIIPYFKKKEGPKILIGDNLSSHLSVDLIEICKQENISFVFVPGDSTHLTLPLDIAFFEPMKSYWRNILLRWKISVDGQNNSIVPQKCIPKLLKELMTDLSENSEDNIKSGFWKAGIVPLNSQQVLSRLPRNEEDNADNTTDAVELSVLDLLKEMRCESMNIQKLNRKRKTKMEPEQSALEDRFNDESIKKRKEAKKLESDDVKSAEFTLKIQDNIKQYARIGKMKLQNKNNVPKDLPKNSTVTSQTLKQYKKATTKHVTVSATPETSRINNEKISQNNLINMTLKNERNEERENIRNQEVVISIFDDEDSQENTSYCEIYLEPELNITQVEGDTETLKGSMHNN